MKKMTKLVLISAVLATSGLTAKVATENYKAVVDNDERIHKAYELAKKPSKAAVLEEIVDAANAVPDERIHDAVVIDPEEPKVVRVKTKVTTSAGVSPLSPTMDKKTVNKAEEFIGKIAYPAEWGRAEKQDFTSENIPVQELKYETKDIFPEFEEMVEELQLSYKIRFPDGYDYYSGWTEFFFDINGTRKSSGGRLNAIRFRDYTLCDICGFSFDASVSIKAGMDERAWVRTAYWFDIEDSDYNSSLIKFDAEPFAINYSALAPFKDSNKELYDFMVGVETGKYPLLAVVE